MALAVGVFSLLADQSVGHNLGVPLDHARLPAFVLANDVCVKHKLCFIDFAENCLVSDPSENPQRAVSLSLLDFSNGCRDFVSFQDSGTKCAISRHRRPVIAGGILIYLEGWDSYIMVCNNIERGVCVNPKGWCCARVDKIDAYPTVYLFVYRDSPVGTDVGRAMPESW